MSGRAIDAMSHDVHTRTNLSYLAIAVAAGCVLVQVVTNSTTRGQLVVSSRRADGVGAASRPAMPTTRPATATTRPAGGDGADGAAFPVAQVTAKLKAAGMSDEQAAWHAEQMQSNAKLRETMVSHVPGLDEVLNPPAPPPAPRERLSELRDRDARGARARELVGRLATAGEDELAALRRRILACGRSAMVPLKLAELSDNFELRRRARDISRRLRWHVAASEPLLEKFPTLVAVMAGGEVKARAHMVDEVAQWAKPAAIGFFGECLADRQIYVRQRAVDGLVGIVEDGDYENRNALRRRVQPVLQQLLSDTDRNIRLMAVGALARVGAVDIEYVSAMLEDESMEVRATALRTLGFSRTQEAVPHILPLLSDPQWRVRAAALQALEKLIHETPGEKVQNAVSDRLADPESFVRNVAVMLLGEWECTAEADRILQLVRERKVSELTGIEALAAMNSPQAKAEAMRRYDSSTDPAHKAALLDAIDSFDPDARVDDALAAALQDESMRPAWGQLFQQAGYRRDEDRFFPLIAEHLLDEDVELAEAAWNTLRRDVEERPLPAEVREALLRHPEPQRVCWALLCVSGYRADDAAEVYRNAAAHDSAQVRAQALGLLALDRIGDALGVPEPAYRRSDYGEALTADVMPDAVTDAQPSEPPDQPDLPDVVRDRLDDSDPLVRALAAALVLRSTDADDPRARDVARNALGSERPEVRNVALAAIVDDPEPFVESVDLAALARSEPTSRRALEVIAAMGDAAYTPVLLELAETRPSRLMLKLLIRAGTDETLEAAMAAFQERYQHYAMREFVEEDLPGMPGRGPVRFLDWALQQPWHEHQQWLYESMIETAGSLPHPSVKPLLERILDEHLDKLGDYANTGTRSTLLARLAELAPEEYVDVLRKELLSVKPIGRQAALHALLRLEPTAETVGMLFEIATSGTEASKRIAWNSVAGWLPAGALRQTYLPALEKVPFSLQKGLLTRVLRTLRAEDLKLLTGLSVEDPFLRQVLAAIIGRLSAHRVPEASDAALQRPALEGVAPGALPVMLTAVGDWPDAPDVLAAYLQDERVAVAEAAGEGLAYYVLGHPDARLSPEAVDALASAAVRSGPMGSYLAVEALAVAAPERLGELPLTELSGAAAQSRLLLARAGELTAEQHMRLCQQIHGGAGNTAARLAAAALARAGGQAPPLSYTRLRYGIGVSDATLTDLLATLDGAHVVTDLAPHLPWRRHPEARARVRAFVRTARKDDTTDFVRLARLEVVERPSVDDLLRLLQHADSCVGRRAPFDDIGTDCVALAVSWAPREPIAAVVDSMSAESTAGTLAGAVAWLCWGDAKGRAVVLAAATQQPEAELPSPQQHVAWSALKLGLTADHAGALSEYVAKLPHDEWWAQRRAAAALSIIAAVDPHRAIATNEKYFGARERHFVDRARWLAEATVALADAPEAPDVVPEHLPAPLGALHDALLRARAASAPDGAGGANAGAPSAGLLPPWDVPKDRPASSHAADAESRNAFDTLVEAMRRTDSPDPVESGAPRAPLATPQRSTRLVYVDDDEWMGSAAAAGIRGGAAPQHGPQLDQDAAALIRSSCESFHGSEQHAALDALAGRLPAAYVQKTLRPLLSGESDTARRFALRLAAALNAEGLAEEIAAVLQEDAADAVEAAWALALLRDREAIAPIERAYRAQTDFTRRVRLACLLRLLGSDAGRGDIDRAVSLWVIRRFRRLFVERVLTDAGQHRFARPATGTIAVLAPWHEALQFAAGDVLRAAESRFHLPRKPSPPAPVDEPVRTDLTGLALRAGQLTAPGLRTHGLPLSPLAMDSAQDVPTFARLCVAEQALEPHCFVQFADQCDTPAELYRTWRAWWAENADRPRSHWWRQAVAQAIDEVTHRHWWHRARALRRLARLTGRRAALPALFDAAACAAAQKEWRRWWRAAAFESAPQCLAHQAAASGLTFATTRASDDVGHRRLLVRLAGCKVAPLNEAALLQLQAAPACTAELAEGALAWQRCANRALALWVRRTLRAATGRSRLFYAPDNLGTAASSSDGQQDERAEPREQ